MNLTAYERISKRCRLGVILARSHRLETTRKISVDAVRSRFFSSPRRGAVAEESDSALGSV